MTTLKDSTEIMTRKESPTFNHTRSDGFYNPCPECVKLMTTEELAISRSDKLRPKHTTLVLNPAARALLVEILTAYVENTSEAMENISEALTDVEGADAIRLAGNLAWAEAVVDKLNTQIISDCEEKE